MLTTCSMVEYSAIVHGVYQGVYRRTRRRTLMPKITARKAEHLVRHHPKNDKDGLERMFRAFGSIPFEGTLPSKYFLEERTERWLAEDELAERASD